MRITQAGTRWSLGRLGGLAGLGVGVVVPCATLPTLPRFAPWPVAAGLVIWTAGKYLVCPVRWFVLSASGRPLRWHLAVQAQSELLGLVTPGHLGGDVWRVRRLRSTGLPRLAAVAEITTDKAVGAAGVGVLGVLAASALPGAVLGLAAAVLLGGLVLRRARPSWRVPYRLPGAGALAVGLLLTLLDQLTTVALLIGALVATGHPVAPLAALTAFGASQLAGVIPGPQGASPRDGALVVALSTLGVPWPVALGAVTLKAVAAYVPGILLGGGCLLLAHRFVTAGDRAAAAPEPGVPEPAGSEPAPEPERLVPVGRLAGRPAAVEIPCAPWTQEHPDDAGTRPRRQARPAPRGEGRRACACHGTVPG